MKKIRTKRGLLGTLMIAAILGTGCNTEQSVPELYVDDNIRETPVTAFTENIEVSKAIEERCKAVLNQDGNTNIAVYSDSADYYAAEGLSYRELLLKRLASGNADDLYTIHAEDVLEFDEKGYIYDMSSLEFTGNLSHDALSQSTYNGKVFSIPLSYTGFGFIWNVDMLKQYGLKLPENLDEFLDVCETLKENGILPYGANKDFALTVPVMCAGLYDVYQSDDCNQKLEALSNGTVAISEYMEKGFDSDTVEGIQSSNADVIGNIEMLYQLATGINEPATELVEGLKLVTAFVQDENATQDDYKTLERKLSELKESYYSVSK